MKPTSPFSAQTLLPLDAKHVQSDRSYNAAKPLCEVNRCAVHTAVPLPGPKTEQGRKRCAEANFMHGWETRKKRQIRAEKFREMKAWMRLLDEAEG